MAITPNSLQLLNDLGIADLERAARDRRYPKWSTMCQLRRYGLPVLNACHIPPGQPLTALHSAIRSLAAAVGADQLMLRSDGGIETGRYYRGGNTFTMDELGYRASALLEAGRAVLLLEPTNRFTNRMAALLRLDRPYGRRSQVGEFTVEGLGPGYDVADLTRGGIAPQVTITISGVDWGCYEEPWWRDMQVTRDLGREAEAARREQRLRHLAGHVLADIGELPDTDESNPQDVEYWLRERSYVDLFIPHDVTLRVVANARSWFADAFVLGRAHPNRDWQCLAVALSDLGDGRIVFWDLVDGAHKYGTTGSHTFTSVQDGFTVGRSS